MAEGGGLDPPVSRPPRASNAVRRLGGTLHGGRDDRTRTCDVAAPSRVLYLLSYIPVAEEVGFEPTGPSGPHAFQTCRFSHSRTPPDGAGARPRTRILTLKRRDSAHLSYTGSSGESGI